MILIPFLLQCKSNSLTIIGKVIFCFKGSKRLKIAYNSWNNNKNTWRNYQKKAKRILVLWFFIQINHLEALYFPQD